ncbi:MAG: TraG family conjugative transposon ATPase [Rikenellaceae bacterium]
MKNILRTATLESKFPLLAVESGCIVSKDSDITIAYRVELPELYTLTAAEYESLHTTWIKAIKVLPNYSIIHKQDWFTSERYESKESADNTFLSNAFEHHFNERPYLHHTCYLFVTKTTKERSRTQSNFNTLCRGHILPKEMNRETRMKFIEAVGQFECIINDSGLLRISRLSEQEIVGSKDNAGIVEKYFSLSQSDTTTLHDITLNPDEMRIGDKILCLHTLSEVDDLPSIVDTDSRYEKLSTDRSDCRLSFAAPIGLLLSCDHIVNQYIFIDDSAENLRTFEKSAKNLHSLSRYSRANQINKAWIDEYLNDAHSLGLTSVRTHCNVMAWSENREELKHIKNEVGSQIAIMGCKPRHNTVDLPTLYWAAIPGNAGDFPSEESLYTFTEQAVTLFCEETNYRDSPSPFGIKMVDRMGRPLHLDISDLPMKRGVITNRNKFVLGPSGSGKSFFMNHMVRQYYEQGTHVVLVDTGNSYQGLCNMINRKTNGEDGIYYTYTEESPISFNPFYTEDHKFDVEKMDSIKTLLLTLWKSDDERISKTESGELGSAVASYIKRIVNDHTITPNFNTFYEFMLNEYRTELEHRAIRVRRDEFDIDNFLTTTMQYYRGGRYDFLLNSDANIDLLNKRFIVFEIDSIKENRELFPIVTIIIMEAFINKMRRVKGVRKQLICEEAWKALSSPSMASYMLYLYKTVRKYFGEAIVVTQEVDDIISSPIVKEAIINNSDCKILLDQRKYMNKFDAIQNLLGLSDKERSQILSINLANDPKRLYKEVWIGLGGAQSAVYATEVSIEEYLSYTTEESEKVEVQRLTEEMGGDIEGAIKQLAKRKRKERE